MHRIALDQALWQGAFTKAALPVGLRFSVLDGVGKNENGVKMKGKMVLVAGILCFMFLGAINSLC